MAKKQDPQEERPLLIQEFHQQIEGLEGSEEKLRLCLDTLKQNLSQEVQPRFREFWEVRDTAVALFRDGIHPAVRAKAWEELSELSREARRLKAHLQSHAAYTAEQLELAVKSLEQEVAAVETTGGPCFETPDGLEVLQESLNYYQQTQRTVDRLWQAGQQLQALRQEVSSSKLPSRDRNALFKRLSLLGDETFPKRKRLRDDLAERFTSDVKQFFESNFIQPIKGQTPFWLRQQIKALQLLAKTLSIGKRPFEACRKLLCDAWERACQQERSRKEEMIRKREEGNAQLRQLGGEIESAVTAYGQREVSKAAFTKQLERLNAKVAKSGLGVRERRTLTELIESAEDRLGEEERNRAQQLQEQEEQKSRASAELAEKLQARIEELQQCAREAEREKVQAQRDAIVEEMNKAQLAPEHRGRLRRQLQPLSDDLLLQEEESTLAAAATREPLERVLGQRMERRTLIRSSLAEYRQLAETSKLDFAKAMDYHDLVEAEKGRLSQIGEAIERLQSQLRDWQQ